MEVSTLIERAKRAYFMYVGAVRAGGRGAGQEMIGLGGTKFKSNFCFALVFRCTPDCVKQRL